VYDVKNHARSLDPRYCICGRPAEHFHPIRVLDGAPPPTTDDENSRAAAVSMELPAHHLRRAVFDAIAAHGPIATWELEELLGRSHQSVSARVWELKGARLILRAGKNRTPSGRAAWRYVVAGPSDA
jgi:hypothetical protein